MNKGDPKKIHKATEKELENRLSQNSDEVPMSHILTKMEAQLE